MIQLADLGVRICIIGPSGAGKSTLADALSDHLRLPTVFLDSLYHRPHTAYVPRPAEEFDTLHAAVVAGPAWIMEGNYSRTLPERLARATGIIWLDMTRWTGLLGYAQRSVPGTQRHGRLAGASEQMNWTMLRYIVAEQPRKRAELARIVEGAPLPMVRIKSRRELAACYSEWGITPSL